MSLIACTDHCVYQQDGYCTLSLAGSSGRPSKKNPCVNYIPRKDEDSDNSTEDLADVADPDEL